MYRLDKDKYNDLLRNAITTTYKKADNRLLYDINKDGQRFAKNANVLERIDVNGTSNCFITLKDHKENFDNNPTTRLIPRQKMKLVG